MRILINLLPVVFALLAGAALAGDTSIAEDQAVIQFDTRLGIVTFQHRMHAGLSSVECGTCHHTWDGTGPVKACHACHAGKDGEAPAAKKIFHSRCIGCHEYTVAEGNEAGPLKKKCKLCHVK